jgi:hypothetical protein
VARSNLLLETQLKTSRLPTFLREYDKLLEAGDERRLLRAQKQLVKQDLLIVDPEAQETPRSAQPERLAEVLFYKFHGRK